MSELYDGRCGGVCGSRTTSVAREARGRGRAVEDEWESRGRGVAVRVVLRDAEAAGAAAKETWENRLSWLGGRLRLVRYRVHCRHK